MFIYFGLLLLHLERWITTGIKGIHNSQ